MKYDYTFSILKAAVKDPTIISDKINEILVYFDKTGTNSSMQNIKSKSDTNTNMDNNFSNNNYESEKLNQENNEGIPVNDSNCCNYSSNNGENNYYYNQKQTTSSNPQGIIDSIAQDLTPVKLQQAIILSEIVGKPRSKNRRKRRRF